MRLIDADELKKELAKNITIWTFNVSYDGILAEIIDNASPVETDIEVVAKDAYEQGYTDGWKERFGEPNERPQGEWITHKVAFHLTCSFCGCNLRAIKRDVFEGDYDYNFCPNCGAKMGGGVE